MRFLTAGVVVLGGIVAIVLAIILTVNIHGFIPSRGRSIFKEDKKPQHDFPRRGSKAVGPMC
jgi:hypothetical protein